MDNIDKKILAEIIKKKEALGLHYSGMEGY